MHAVVHTRLPSRCKRKTASIITSRELGAPDWDWQSGFFADFLRIVWEHFSRNQLKKRNKGSKVGSPTMQKDLCGKHFQENRNSTSAHVINIGQKLWRVKSHWHSVCRQICSKISWHQHLWDQSKSENQRCRFTRQTKVTCLTFTQMGNRILAHPGLPKCPACILTVPQRVWMIHPCLINDSSMTHPCLINDSSMTHHCQSNQRLIIDQWLINDSPFVGEHHWSSRV